LHEFLMTGRQHGDLSERAGTLLALIRRMPNVTTTAAETGVDRDLKTGATVEQRTAWLYRLYLQSGCPEGEALSSWLVGLDGWWSRLEGQTAEGNML